MFLGSKHSSPIEQLTGEQLDQRADIYGAGTVLFHCYRGVPMYHAVGPEGAIVRRMLQRPERIELRADKEESDERKLVDFINRCISVDKAGRPSSVTECMRRIEELSRGRHLD